MRLVQIFSMLVMASSPLTIMAVEPIDFHGYFRSGSGANSEGGDQVCFKLPGAQSKYRLGNECETYGAFKLGKRVYEGEDGSWFRVQTQLAYEVAAEKDFEKDGVAMREVYAEGGGLVDGRWKEARFWVGKRLLRQDVHITDFFYWDNSGAGGGFDNLGFDDFKLSYSLIQNVKEGLTPLNSGSDRAITTHDLRFYDIETNPQGLLTVGLAAIQDSKGEDGWQLHLQHQQKSMTGGFNRIALQYGRGAGATLGKTPADNVASGDETWRLVEQLTIEPAGNWAGQATLVYEDRKDKQQWLSFGVRPIYHFSEHFNLALELGHDQVNPEQGASMRLNKVTVAPQLAKGRGFFSRPVLRAFVTYADWNAAARDALENPVAGGATGVYGLKTEGISYGIQVEAWW